jgi:hypothetical protein
MRECENTMFIYFFFTVYLGTPVEKGWFEVRTDASPRHIHRDRFPNRFARTGNIGIVIESIQKICSSNILNLVECFKLI